MTRKVVLYIAMSLDGFIATEEEGLAWLDSTENGGSDGGYHEMYDAIDTTIIGKRTYEWIMANAQEFPYPTKKNYVMTAMGGEAPHVEFINEDATTFIQSLKQQEGGDIWLVGGAAIATAFMQTNSIDEYIIAIAPHILGSGISLFANNTQPIALQLIKTYGFGEFVYVHYRAKE